MTPKEKAVELVEKFSSRNMLGLDTSIKFALVAVDELIKEAQPDVVTISRGSLTDLEFWNKVKSEIKKL